MKSESERRAAIGGWLLGYANGFEKAAGAGLHMVRCHASGHVIDRESGWHSKRCKCDACLRAVTILDEWWGPAPLTHRSPTDPTTRRCVISRSEGQCASCHGPPPFDVDHIVPVALGGTDDLSNLQALCKPCHRRKTSSDVATIAASRAG